LLAILVAVGRTTVDTFDPPSGTAETVSAPGEPSARSSNRIILDHGACVGRYVILSAIGRGGMGVVYAAHDPQLDRQVALKLLRTTDSPEEAERLVREAQALAKLTDPHVVAVYDAGEVDGQVFVAMQLVDGEDLAAALQKRRRSEDVSQVLSWFRDAGRGLAAAHAARLIHRDFKPSNVLIDKTGRVAVTDFGIAREQGRTHDPERRALSSANKLIGTPAYMSPEQHAMERATEASDQFAFCVSLWEALFDCHPFVADRAATSSVEIGIAIFEGKILPPRRRGRVPRRIVDTLERGLSRDPGARWPSMTALVEALGPAQPRRKWPFAVAAAVAVGGAAVAVMVWPASSPGESAAIGGCDLDADVQAAWQAHRDEVLHEVVAASYRGYARRVGKTLGERLDSYAERLGAEAREVCAQRGAVATPVVAARLACVAERTAELAGFVEEMDAALPTTVDHVLAAEELLEPVMPCAAVQPSDSTGQLDNSRGIARKIGVGLGELAHGRSDEAESLICIQSGRAAGLHRKQIEARALYLCGAIEADRDEPATESLRAAISVAADSGADGVAAPAWIVYAQALSGDAADAAWLAADAAVARTGIRDVVVREQLVHALALVRHTAVDSMSSICKSYLDDAATPAPAMHLARLCLLAAAPFRRTEEATFNADLDALERVYGRDHPEIADTLYAHALNELSDGARTAARRDLTTVLGLYAQRYPEEHAKLASVHHALGWVELREHHLDAARAEFTAAVTAIGGERTHHAYVAAGMYSDLARVLHGSEALAAARTGALLYPRVDVLATYASISADNAQWDVASVTAKQVLDVKVATEIDRGHARWALARALVARHGSAADATKIASEARLELATSFDTDAVAAIDAWLQLHR
jgi:hypothetical protein